MSIEVMKQALEALETYHSYMEPLTTVVGGPRVPAEQSTTGKVERSITSLRQAIAELEKREPAAWGMEHPDGDIIDVITPEEHAREEGGYTVALYREPQLKREPPKAGDGRDLFYEAVRLLDNAIFAQSGDVVRHDLAAHKEALDFFNHVFTQLDLPPTQPKREWVGLTDEVIEQGQKESWVTKQAWESAVWWAEAKLKELNT